MLIYFRGFSLNHSSLGATSTLLEEKNLFGESNMD